MKTLSTRRTFLEGSAAIAVGPHLNPIAPPDPRQGQGRPPKPKVAIAGRRLGRATARAETSLRQLPGQSDRRPSRGSAGHLGAVSQHQRSRPGAGRRCARRLSGPDLVGPCAQWRDRARGRPVDRREDQGRPALADRASLGALVDAVRGSHVRANAASTSRQESTCRHGRSASRVSYVPPPQRYTRSEGRCTDHALCVVAQVSRRRAKAAVHLPYCCFPAYRGDGKPSDDQGAASRTTRSPREFRANFSFRRQRCTTSRFTCPSPTK